MGKKPPKKPPQEPAEVVEVIPATVRQAVRDAFEESGPDIRALAGDRILLDVLDELAPTDPDRAGIRATVEYVSADGLGHLVPRCWDTGLPTYERLGGMVAKGALRPGTYRVLLRKATTRGSAPWIRMHIAPPVGVDRPGAPPEASALGQLRDLSAIMRDMQPAGAGELAGKLDGALREVDALTARVETVEAQLAELEAMATQLTQAAGGGDAPMTFLDVLKAVPEAMQAVRSINGEGVVEMADVNGAIS